MQDLSSSFSEIFLKILTTCIFASTYIAIIQHHTYIGYPSSPAMKPNIHRGPSFADSPVTTLRFTLQPDFTV